MIPSPHDVRLSFPKFRRHPRCKSESFSTPIDSCVQTNHELALELMRTEELLNRAHCHINALANALRVGANPTKNAHEYEWIPCGHSECEECQVNSPSFRCMMLVRMHNVGELYQGLWKGEECWMAVV